MKIAVFGCLHGQLDDMFNAVHSYESQNNIEIDLIIVCGDCQTIRHQDDLQCLAVPNKYKKLGDFHQYYSGTKKVPRLTLFVGGNHEASNYLMTLPYGGWVCPNFYYMGFASVVTYRGLRIGGISGIYNHKNCNRGRFERLPLDEESMRSIYHTRRLDVFRLSLLSQNINHDKGHRPDIFMSHDWPARIYEHGNVQQLLRFKPYFRQDIESRNGLGNPMTQALIKSLKPRHWFAAHLHCKFEATVQHDKEQSTKFLSLNKIDNQKHYVEYLDIEPSCSPTSPGDSDPNELYYDPEWLTILKKTIELEYKSGNNVPCPNVNDKANSDYFPTETEIAETRETMMKSGGLQIKRNFCMSEPVIYNREGDAPASIDKDRAQYFPNPQHLDLCSRLGIIDKLDANSSTSNNSVDHDRDRRQNNHYVHPHSQSRSRANQSEFTHRNKRQAIELDEDGCLPIFVDKKGEPSQ